MQCLSDYGVRASNACEQSSLLPEYYQSLPAFLMLTCHSLRSLAAVQVEASLKDRPHELASALTVQATHDASAAHQVLQGKLVRSTTSGAIAKGCGPYTEQAEGAVVSTPHQGSVVRAGCGPVG